MEGEKQVDVGIFDQINHLLFLRVVYNRHVVIVAGKFAQAGGRLHSGDDKRDVYIRKHFVDEPLCCPVVVGHTEFAMKKDILAAAGQTFDAVVRVKAGM